ncbi:protein-glutamate O-methyltransferase CheR, partial [bacterium]|nr:protein-glutamate O-methyltransferase CheR [bacterium]
MQNGSATQERQTATVAPEQRMSDEHFEAVRSLMGGHVGIVLQGNRRALVESRVTQRLRRLGIEDYGEYLEFLRRDESGRELVMLIDAISTNVTEFFREDDHFDFIRDAAKRWLAEGRQKLRLWSAACSSGEEAYSLAMALRSLPGGEAADIRILATDISTRMLRKAVQGNYLEDVVATIPADLAERFLLKQQTPDGEIYRVSDALKNMIVFRRLNLNDTPYAVPGTFDLIMCRNVMIYFDQDLRDRIVTDNRRLLRPGAYLLPGHAETRLVLARKSDCRTPSVRRP